MAAQSGPDDADAELEKRVHAFSQQVRCLVCQNETLADSRAELAVDLRREIREQMKAGRSDEEITAFLTERYGDFVLYRPPLKPSTYPLWFGPFVLLAGGLCRTLSLCEALADTYPTFDHSQPRSGDAFDNCWTHARERRPRDDRLLGDLCTADRAGAGDSSCRRCDIPIELPLPARTTEANVAVYRRQLAEMESDLRHRIITNEQFVRDREELERRAVVDLPKESRDVRNEKRTVGSGALVLCLAAGLPLAAIVLYLALGTPASIHELP